MRQARDVVSVDAKFTIITNIIALLYLKYNTTGMCTKQFSYSVPECTAVKSLFLRLHVDQVFDPEKLEDVIIN